MTGPGKDDRVLPFRELTRERIPAQREAMVIRAADSRCECCGAKVPAHRLEIHHLLPGAGPEERDPVDLLLVLCRGCHRSIHQAGIDERIIAILADARPARTRLRIRKILSGSLPYSPPDSGDPADIYTLALGFGGTDLFLNGA
jgi:hypothetical protein